MGSSARALALDDHLCFAIYSAGIAINRAYKPLLDALDLTYPQYLVLVTLWEKDAVTIGAIAEQLSLDSSTITPLVKRLVTAGLIARERNPQDDRQVIIRLTDKGREMQERSACLAETLLAKSQLSIAAIQTLNRQVSALRDAVAQP